MNIVVLHVWTSLQAMLTSVLQENADHVDTSGCSNMGVLQIPSRSSHRSCMGITCYFRLLVWGRLHLMGKKNWHLRNFLREKTPSAVWCLLRQTLFVNSGRWIHFHIRFRIATKTFGTSSMMSPSTGTMEVGPVRCKTDA